MKLLFDENLAPRLARDLSDLYPGTAHILELGLGGADDQVIWVRAAEDNFVLLPSFPEELLDGATTVAESEESAS